MKVILFFLVIIPFSFFSQGGYYDDNKSDVSQICDFYRGNNFATNLDAERAMDRVLNVVGMSQRFVIYPCNDINNCMATTYKGIRYILYDKDFMHEIADNSDSWAKLSILAHEVGHHLNGHSVDLLAYASGEMDAPTLRESRQMELEADEFSGFVLQKLGASLAQAQAAINTFGSDRIDTYSTHPSKDKRLGAISKGYYKAKNQSSTATDAPALSAEDYFYRAYNAPKNSFQFQIDNYTEAIRINPDFAVAYYNRGTAYNDLKNYTDAIADFSRAIRINPDFANAYYNRGLAYNDLKNYTDAIADYSRAIRINPDFANAYYNRGLAYKKLKNYTDAIADCSRAIRINPDHASAYVNRGNAYGKLKNYTDAIADYSRAIRINPDFAIAYYCRGLAKQATGLPFCSDYKKGCQLGYEVSCEWYNEQCR